MRNHKNIDIKNTPIGTRVKVAIPSFYAHHKKDRNKKYSWFKGKIIDKYDNGCFIVNLKVIGRMIFCNNYRIVKCL